MGTNNRIFYACQAVAIVPKTGHRKPTANDVLLGVQGVGLSSTFTLDQVFELGQIEIYENIEDVADIEVTLEKVIDGHPFIYEHASNFTCRTDLVTASKNRCDVYLAIYDDGLSHATGVPRNVCWNSGMYTSSVSYNYSVDGSATESVTLVGNDRMWNDNAGDTALAANNQWNLAGAQTDAIFDGDHTPKSGVVRRVNVDIKNSTLPDIVGSQKGADPTSARILSLAKHLQSISVSTDFGQEQINELGRFGPYARYATFPIEVTSEFEVISTSGDLVSVSGSTINTSNQAIVIKDTAGTVLDLGAVAGTSGKNKLSSVSYSGGDTGGGNASITYSFSNFNVLTVTSSAANTAEI